MNGWIVGWMERSMDVEWLEVRFNEWMVGWMV